jgi:hypothetical protein
LYVTIYVFSSFIPLFNIYTYLSYVLLCLIAFTDAST